MTNLTSPLMTRNIVRSEEDFLRIYGPPIDLAIRKSLTKLEKHSRHFIECSPFIIIGSFGPRGADVSPRGDPAGFVRILDDRHLLLPDRPGNNRLDTMRNISVQPMVGLIFFVPGVLDTLRVNGHAVVTSDAALLEPCAVDGKVPLTGIVVEIEELFIHCAKALLRSSLWKPENWPAKGLIPSAGRMVKDHLNMPEDVEKIDALIEQVRRDTLY